MFLFFLLCCLYVFRFALLNYFCLSCKFMRIESNEFTRDKLLLLFNISWLFQLKKIDHKQLKTRCAIACNEETKRGLVTKQTKPILAKPIQINTKYIFFQFQFRIALVSFLLLFYIFAPLTWVKKKREELTNVILIHIQ